VIFKESWERYTKGGRIGDRERKKCKKIGLEIASKRELQAERAERNCKGEREGQKNAVGAGLDCNERGPASLCQAELAPPPPNSTFTHHTHSSLTS